MTSNEGLFASKIYIFFFNIHGLVLVVNYLKLKDFKKKSHKIRNLIRDLFSKYAHKTKKSP